MSRYAAASVPVVGGRLHVGCWRGDDRSDPVLAVHGVTAHHLAWTWVADALSDREVLAPDLRGRGRSRGLPPPYGMAAHADDVLRVLDGTGHDRAVLVGHSMGAFVALVAAHRYPDRVSGLVLVDGGPPLPVPPGLDPDAITEAVIGPSLQRIAMRFADVEEHRDVWRVHPALAGEWGERLASYADADLHGDPPELAPRTVREAVDADSRDLLGGPAVREAQRTLAAPTVLVRAAEGMVPGSPPLYDDAALAGRERPSPRVTTVRDVNHYTVVMSDRGARAVAGEIASLDRRG